MNYSTIHPLSSKRLGVFSQCTSACSTSKLQLPGELTESGQLPASAAARAACSAFLHCYLLRARSSKSTHIRISRRAIHTRIIIYPRSLISIPTSYFHTNSPNQASRARRRINDVYTTSQYTAYKFYITRIAIRDEKNSADLQ